MTGLVADCLKCAFTARVAADELFDFDTRCPRCGELLILDEEEPPEGDPDFEYTRFRTGTALPAGSEAMDFPFGDDEGPDFDRDEFERDLFGSEEVADPYALAAAELDPSVGKESSGNGSSGSGSGRVPAELKLEATTSHSSSSRISLPKVGSSSSRDRVPALPEVEATSPPLPRLEGGDTGAVAELAGSSVEAFDRGPLAEVKVSDSDLEDDDDLLLDDPAELHALGGAVAPQGELGGSDSAAQPEPELGAALESSGAFAESSGVLAESSWVLAESSEDRVSEDAVGEDAVGEDELDVPSMTVPEGGTIGRASRSYDAPTLVEQLQRAAEASLERDAGEVADEDALEGLRAPTLTTPTLSSALPESAMPPELTLPGTRADVEAAAEGLDPALDTARLFPPDVDWLALLDDRLGEGDEFNEETGRYMIRVPQTAAGRLEEPETIRRMQAALEASGVAGLEQLLANGTGSDSRIAQRFRSGEETPQEQTASFGSEPPDDVEPSETAAFTRSSVPAPSTQAWGEGGPTRPPTPTSSTPVTPPRSESLRRRSVEQFTRADMDQGLVCARDPNSREADHFRQLYQRVFHAYTDDPPRVVLVTSARPGEGKTTVASNLAIVGARIPGGGALLIDADPRGRGVYRAFGQRATTDGLLEGLQTGQPPERYAVRFKMKELDVIPLGLRGSDAVELIASDTMGDFVNRARASFSSQSIVIDSSPVLTSADPMVLSRIVDGVILVVRAGVTSRQDVERALDLIGRQRILGVVLNDALVEAA